MKYMWHIVFGILPIAGLVYAIWRVWFILPLSNVWRSLAITLFVMAFFSIFLNFSRTIDHMPLNLAIGVYEVGNTAIFVLLYLVMLFLALDLGRLCHLVPRQWLHSNPHSSLAIFIFMVAIFTYGNINYKHKVRQPLTLQSNGKLERDVKIVLISDLHLGYHNRRSELHRWVEMINSENPDLILIGGDIIDISLRPLIEDNDAAELKRFKAPVYACLGNHEYYSGDSLAEQFYKDAGINLLRDSMAVACGINIIGRDDRSNPHRKNLAAIVKKFSLEGRFTILLDHQPYHLEQAARQGIDFQFSGHTHHGQVWPISWITELIYEDAFGTMTKGNTQYYVSSGIGIWGGKFRIGTRSEYVVATIHK